MKHRRAPSIDARVARWRGRGRRVLVFVGSIAPLALLAGTARAESPEATARAQALFEQGERAMNAGDFAQACPKLEEAQRLVRGIGVTLRLADCYEKSGRTASAWAQFKAAEALAQDRQDPREAVAHSRAALLEGHLARVRVIVSTTISGLEVSEDGATLGQAEWGESLPVDQGDHVIRARASGYVTFETHVTAKDDAPPVDVRVPDLDKEVTSPSPSTPAPAPAPSPTESPSRLTWVAWTGFGVAVAGAALGTVTGIITLNDASQIHGFCPTDATCRAGSVGKVDSLRDDGRTMGTISTVSFVVAGAGALTGTGALIFHWGGSKATPARASLFVGPESVWLRGEF